MMKIRPPDHERRGEDQQPGLAQRLAEEAEDLEPETSPTTRAQKRMISPNDEIQSRGTRASRSFEVQDLRVGGQQRLREHVVEREHAEGRDHHGLVDGAPTPWAPPVAVMPL
jgi:hypothetical protein